MPVLTAADTIRILVATDNHVGYCERDHIRGNDSWRSFHEVMCLAKERDVDMVLLAGDLFHENKPSRQSMYQVMRSMRMNCYGEKPCELEVLSDMSENFQGAFNHVNYEDPDINVAIPVFSIHGNHDDPSGEGHYAALDLLQVSGLVNYYGRVPESDNIQIKPVLLQKGNTKLALYGMSNVRDERLFRTFRDGRVKLFQPKTQKDDWFNLMSVHQNHHAHTETGYLPENFLPDFLDLVVWGHEHECLIEPRYNREMNFHVMQPGSSIATSLMPGEAVAKHVAVLTVTGRDFQVEPIRLKTVRPFVMKEIILSEDKLARKIAKQSNHGPELTRHLMDMVEELIKQANAEWQELHQEETEYEEEMPLPLVRLRVEYSAPDGIQFQLENPQRFSNRFVNKVANVNDVVQFHRKKASTSRKTKDNTDMPEESIMAQLTIDSVKVEKLVREFLEAQSLTILPQNSFGDAVNQFVDKDDKHAMETFVSESLESQIKNLMNVDEVDEDILFQTMDQQRSKLEELFAAGHLKRLRKARMKPPPETWDSEMDGHWSDQPAAWVHEGNEAEEEEGDDAESVAPAKSRGKAATAKKPVAAKKAAPAKGGRGKKKVVEEDSEEEQENVVMVDSEVDDSQSLFLPSSKPSASTRAAKKPAPRKASPAKKSPASRTKAKAAPNMATKQLQSKLNFSQPTSQINGKAKKPLQLSDDEISDDDDAFEPAPSTATVRSTRNKR